MSLSVRFQLNFNAPIVLHGFLPETEALGLQISHESDRYHITAYLGDRATQLANREAIPTEEDALRKVPCLMCKGLTILIRDEHPDAMLLAALEGTAWTNESSNRLVDMIRLAYAVRNGLIEYLRNLGQQAWLEPISDDDPRVRKTLEFELQELRAEWLDTNGTWRPLRVGQDSFVMRLEGRFMDGIDLEEWKRKVQPFVETFLANGKGAPITDVLIANSLRALEQHNGRLAVVESVIALDGVIRTYLPPLLVGLNNGMELDPTLLTKLIEKAGLRLSANLILKANANRLDIDVVDMDMVLEAINVRNEIIHNNRH